MVTTSTGTATDGSTDNCWDVIIVGAGLAGICLSYHFKQQPTLRFLVLESRKDVGGMWDEFNFPGLRTDTPAPLYQYSFHPLPQSDLTMPTRDEILTYLRDVVDTYQLRQHMVFNTHVNTANFDTKSGRWTLSTTATDGRQVTYRCRFYVNCVGYFDLYNPHIPNFPGTSKFQGPIVHTNSWSRQDDSQDIDYANKQVLIIGSGSTTVTVAPAIAKQAKHVIVLQRSPGYIGEWPRHYDSTSLWSIGSKLYNAMGVFLKPLALLLGRMEFQRANQVALESARKRMESHQAWGPVQPGESTDARIEESQKQIEQVVRRFPNLRRHFTPSYYLFEQRQCFAPDGDYLNDIQSGKIEIITAEIKNFTPRGVQLQLLSSDQAEHGPVNNLEKEDRDHKDHVDADVVVLATGLNLKFMSGIQLFIDDQPQNTGECVAYRGGLMMSGIPNLFNIGGYFKGPYTRRVELQVPFILNLIKYVKEHNFRSVLPKWTGGAFSDDTIDPTPNINFLTSAEGHIATTDDWRGPKYVQRDKSASCKPRVGRTMPWRGGWNYYEDYVEFQKASFNDGAFEYS